MSQFTELRKKKLIPPVVLGEFPCNLVQQAHGVWHALAFLGTNDWYFSQKTGTSTYEMSTSVSGKNEKIFFLKVLC